MKPDGGHGEHQHRDRGEAQGQDFGPCGATGCDRHHQLPDDAQSGGYLAPLQIGGHGLPLHSGPHVRGLATAGIQLHAGCQLPSRCILGLSFKDDREREGRNVAREDTLGTPSNGPQPQWVLCFVLPRGRYEAPGNKKAYYYDSVVFVDDRSLAIPRLEDLQDLGMPRTPETLSNLKNIITKSVAGGWGEDSNVIRFRVILGCAAGDFGNIALVGPPNASYGAAVGNARIVAPADNGGGRWDFVNRSRHVFIVLLTVRARWVLLLAALLIVYCHFSDTLDWRNLMVATESTSIKVGGRPKAKTSVPVELLVVTVTTNYPMTRNQEDT